MLYFYNKKLPNYWP